MAEHWHGPKCGCPPEALSEQLRFHEHLAQVTLKRLAAAKQAVAKQQDILKHHEKSMRRLRDELQRSRTQ